MTTLDEIIRDEAIRMREFAHDSSLWSLVWGKPPVSSWETLVRYAIERFVNGRDGFSMSIHGTSDHYAIMPCMTALVLAAEGDVAAAARVASPEALIELRDRVNEILAVHGR